MREQGTPLLLATLAFAFLFGCGNQPVEPMRFEQVRTAVLVHPADRDQPVSWDSFIDRAEAADYGN